MDEQLDLSSPRHVHIVGIGGAGMSAIATVLAQMGHVVSGSDQVASAVTERLVAEGIRVEIGHRAENLADAQVVTYSPAVLAANPELVEARRRGLEVVRRGPVLAAITRQRPTVAIAGTHGKTTTSSMLTTILEGTGHDPSFLVGAEVAPLGTNARWAKGDWLVLEADESYGTFTYLAPEVAVITNIEADHLDYYRTFEGLIDAFAAFAGRAGRVIVGADDTQAAALGVKLGATAVGAGAGAALSIDAVALSLHAIEFDLVDPAGERTHFVVPTVGWHNVRNAALAVGAANAIGISPSDSARALASFAGVSRRFQSRGEAKGVTFVDDYAHLPSEVAATIGAARASGYPRIVAVFQPHRYTRTGTLASSFAQSFTDADVVVVTNIYGAGEPPIDGVSGELVAEAIALPSGGTLVYEPDRKQLAGTVATLLKPGDLCLTLGAGDITTLADEIVNGWR